MMDLYRGKPYVRGIVHDSIQDAICRGAFIPFIVAGDPNMDATEQALLALDRAGADIIELGVPYSVRAQCNACHEVTSSQVMPLTYYQRTECHWS